MSYEQLYDVVAVNLKTYRVRLIARGKTFDDAHACVKLAVMRRGVCEEFFRVVETDVYHEGSIYPQ